MRNDKLRFVVDSRCFNGNCVTTMSDGIHGDYHHETLEEQVAERQKGNKGINSLNQTTGRWPEQAAVLSSTGIHPIKNYTI